jgi:N-acetylglucosamine kinase-like BadF-type ATPase
LNDSTIEQIKTLGFSPRFQTSEEIYKEVADKVSPLIKEDVTEVYFYGSGCSTESAVRIVENAMEKAFPHSNVFVGEDMLAAARALCGHEPGIACILGTGSNSCLFDGEKIIAAMPNLGFILGDEGSAGYMGKRLIQDYIHEVMPAHLIEKFKKRYNNLTRDEVVDAVYNQPMPSRYMASFTKFLFDNLSDPYAYQLVYNSFVEFFDKTVCKYENYKNLKVHFVGSVAFYYNSVLRQVANDKGVTLKNILESPIAGLTLYHQQILSK